MVCALKSFHSVNTRLSETTWFNQKHYLKQLKPQDKKMEVEKNGTFTESAMW